MDECNRDTSSHITPQIPVPSGPLCALPRIDIHAARQASSSHAPFAQKSQLIGQSKNNEVPSSKRKQPDWFYNLEKQDRDLALDLVKQSQNFYKPSYILEQRGNDEWRIIIIDPNVQNLGQFSKEVVDYFTDTLTHSINEWNEKLRLYRVEFKLDLRGIPIKLRVHDEHFASQAVAHKYPKEICISSELVNDVQEYIQQKNNNSASENCDSYFSNDGSTTVCVRLVPEKPAAREVLSHELGHEALAHNQTGIMKKFYESGLKVTEIEAIAFAYRVWMEGVPRQTPRVRKKN